MTRYADPLRCPDCGSALTPGATQCVSCGLTLSGSTAAQLFATLTEADRLLALLHSESPAPAPPPTPPTPPAGEQAPAPAPAATAPRRSLLSGATVPKILLTLGAICLLAAALVFLAVNWERLGVGGRTAVLAGLTVVVAGLAGWSARRGLRAALESLGAVYHGLLLLDLVGADSAGWFGSPTRAELTLVIGAVLVAVGPAGALLVRRSTGVRFTVAEVVTALGGAAVAIGLALVDWWQVEDGFAVGLIVVLAITQATHLARLRVATAGLGVIALGVWVALVLRGLQLAYDAPSWRELWLDLKGWPLMLAVAVPLVTQAGVLLHLPVRRLLVGLGGTALALLLLAPAWDEPPETGLLSLLAILAAGALAVRILPDPAGPGTVLPAALVGAAVAVLVVTFAAVGVDRLFQAADQAWSGTIGGKPGPLDISSDLPDPVFAGLALLTLLASVQAVVTRLAGRPVELVATRSGIGAIALVSWVGATTLGVPVWSWVATGLVLAAGYLADWLLGRRTEAVCWSAAFAAAALLPSLFSPGLTLIALTVAVVGAATVMYVAGSPWLAGLAGSVAIASAGAWLWTAGDVGDWAFRWTGFVALGSVALLTLVHAILTSRGSTRLPVLLGVEIGALVTAPALTGAGLSGTTESTWPLWLAAYLTVVGAGISAVGLAYPPQRLLLWPGGFVLAVASWVRLADLGVEAPEAYTLPWAAVLLLVGTYWVVRRGASTLQVLGPGLALALVPSLLWVLDDPLSWRSLVLGLGCLALIGIGVGLGWSAPLLYGAVAGAVVAVRLASPYIGEAVPRWVIIGTAGTLLVAVGLTWERRLSEARTAWHYVRQLR